MQTKDHNERTGNEPKTCPFFKELDELYGNTATANPSFTMDTLDQGDEETEEKKRKKKQKRRSSDDLKDFLKEQHDEDKQFMQKIHQEKLQRFDRLLDIMADTGKSNTD